MYYFSLCSILWEQERRSHHRTSNGWQPGAQETQNRAPSIHEQRPRADRPTLDEPNVAGNGAANWNTRTPRGVIGSNCDFKRRSGGRAVGFCMNGNRARTVINVWKCYHLKLVLSNERCSCVWKGTHFDIPNNFCIAIVTI